MSAERIDSIYDIPAIEKEQAAVIAAMKATKAAIISFADSQTKIQGVSGVKDLSKALTDLNANTVKTVDSFTKVAVATKAAGDAAIKAAKAQSDGANLGVKANSQLQQSIKAIKSVIDSRFASEAKLITLQSDYTKQTIANRLEIQKSTKEIKAQAEAEAAQIGSRDRATAQIKVLTAQKNKLNLVNAEEKKQYDELVVKIERYENFLKKTGSAAEKQRINIGNYSGAVSVLKTSFDEVAKKMEEMTKAGKTNTDVFAKLEKEYELLNRLVASQEAGFANATQEIRANQKALLELENAGLAGTESFKKLEQATGNLQDQLGDLKARTKQLGSDTFVFDGLIKAAEGLAGMYGVAQGAAALFGNENEDLQKTFVKLQAVMTIIQSLQAVQNALQAESAAMLLIQDVRTKALAISQGIYAVAVGASTGAMKAFRIALLATGIGAIIGLLVLAASAMGAFGDSTSQTTEEIEAQNEALAKNLKQLEDIAAASEQARNRAKGGLNDLKRELQLSEARGDSEEKLFQIKQEIHAKEMFNLRVQFETFKGNAEKQAEITEEAKNLDATILAEKLEFEKKQLEDLAKIKSGSNKKIHAKRLKEVKDELDEIYEVYKIDQQRKIDFLSEDIDNEELTQTQRLNSLQNYLAARLDLIKINEEKELSKASADEKIVIEAKYNDERLRLRKEALEKLAELEKLESAKVIAQATVINDKQLDILKAGIREQEEINKKAGLDELERQKKLADAKKELTRQLIAEISSTALQIATDNIKREEQELDEKQRKLDENTKRQINNINQLGLTEVERVKQTAAVEKEAQFQTEQIEKRKRALAVERAKFEKAANIATIITTGAAAIIKATATLNPGIIALTSAIVALQLAKAISTPLPKYRIGTDAAKAGLAVYGEAGRELVIPKSGNPYLSPGVATLTSLVGGEKIIPADVTANVLAAAGMGGLLGMDRTKAITADSINSHLMGRILEEIKDGNRKNRIMLKVANGMETSAYYLKNIKN